MNYVKNIFIGIWRLMQGMYIVMLNMIRPKVTEQYPENRGEHQYFERFRAQLLMPHDADNRHKCTACGICQNSCPNGTITITTKMIADEATGKEKKVLDRHMWDLGSCTFCALCTQTCPQDAIEWSNRFEHSLFTREKLVHRLNRPGSSLLPKPAPAPQPATVAAAASEPAPAAIPASEPAPQPAPAATPAPATNETQTN